MRTTLTVTALVSALALAGCSGSADTGASDPDAPLVIGAASTPHAEILQFVQDNLAEGAGLEIEVKEFTDYIQPNVALDDGGIDANYFQHEPYLAEQEADAGYDFTSVAPVHLEPLGMYSESVGTVDEIPEGAQLAIPNDPTNGARALQLLEQEGVITLADTGDASATVLDVEDNPKGIEFAEIEAAQLPRSLADVDAAVINGNYAIEAGLNPVDDAIAVEDAEDNPYANLLVVRAGDEDDPRVVELQQLLGSEEVRGYIEETYDGAVIPAF
jgi:D-methionine transport system substrate-binding protein